MAKEFISRIRCDRCKGVVEEVARSYAEGDVSPEAPKPFLYLECQGVAQIKFEDLCGRCQTRVLALCEQIRLEKKVDTKKPVPDKGSETKSSVGEAKASTKNKPRKPNTNKGRDLASTAN